MNMITQHSNPCTASHGESGLWKLVSMFTVGAVIIGVNCLASNSASAAGIPEPDVVLYGNANVHGLAAHQQDSVKLVARLVSGHEIGRFDFADCNADGVLDSCELSCQNPGCIGVTGCGTARDASPQDGLLDDCPGNLYALKVRCESTPDGVSASSNAAVLNPSNPTVVHIFMQVGADPEKFVRDLVISERGKIRRIALSILDLFAFTSFDTCRSGPVGNPPGGSCSAELFAASDYDEDGDVDLRDYAFIQLHFAGK